jgi:hypothetical protein
MFPFFVGSEKSSTVTGQSFSSDDIGYEHKSTRILDDPGRHDMLGFLLLVDAPNFHQTE